MMKSHVRLLLALLTLTLFAACNNIDNPVDIGPVVYGRVVEQSTNTPVEGATVTLAGRSTQTNVHGGFGLMDLPRGAATLKVEKTGYDTHTESIQVGFDTTEKRVSLRRH